MILKGESQREGIAERNIDSRQEGWIMSSMTWLDYAENDYKYFREYSNSGRRGMGHLI